MMPINPRMQIINLGALGNAIGQNANQAPLPTAAGALYRNPNPDESRKRCANCFMWVSSENRCLIHGPDLEVTGDLICGFHVFGAPVEKWMDHPGGMEFVKPEFSGLKPVGGGAVCASCRFFQDQGGGKGLCWGVSKKDDRRPPQPVEFMGWCARYEGK